MFGERYLPLICIAGLWSIGCSCGSDPDVKKNPPPPNAESGFAATCACHTSFGVPIGSAPPDVDFSGEVCLPQVSVDDPAAYCTGPFTEYVKSSILMLAEAQDGRACRLLTINTSCQAVADSKHQVDACQGNCPTVNCTPSNCNQDQILAGTCPCTVPTACGGFGANAACSPQNLPGLPMNMMMSPGPSPQALTSQQSGAGFIVTAHPGAWDHATSSLRVSATVEVACVPLLGCLTASDTKTSPASGNFQVIGRPCPGTSCNIGLNSQIHVDNFNLDFSVGPVSESAKPRNIVVFARAPEGSIAIGPDGQGVIPAGTLTVQASADEGSDLWVASNKTNDSDVPVVVDWSNHTLRIQNFNVNFPDSSGLVNLNGSFSSSVADVYDAMDADGDGVPNIKDNCIGTANPDQHVIKNPVLTVPNDTASCQEPTTGAASAQDVCNGLSVKLTSNAPANFAPGETEVDWTATDAFGKTTTLAQLVEQQPSIVARQGIQVDDRAAVAVSGAVPTLVALGPQGVKIGVEAVVGDVFSIGAISLADRAHALGTLVSQAAITRGNGVVTGVTQQFSTVVTGTFPDFSHPAVSTGSTDVILQPDQVRSLAPGHYRSLVVNSRAKLTLSPGAYSFTSVDFEPQSTLFLSGATELDLTQSLIWRGGVSMSPGTPLPTVFYSGTNQIVLETNGSLHLIAPNAFVVLGAGSSLTFNGTIAANSVELRPDVKLTCQAEAI